MRFVAYSALGATPNVVVDGSGQAATQLTLSHWPKSGTPWPLKADSSAEIALRWVETGSPRVEAEAVSNNHFDEDGLAGVWTVLNGAEALARKDRVAGVARAGDFSVWTDRDAMRAAIAVSAFADEERSPLDRAVFRGAYAEQTGALYDALLPRFAEMVDHPERFQRFWKDEDARVALAEARIADGTFALEEVPELDLAVVRVPETFEAEALHPMALHVATPRTAILVGHGERFELRYRYETWVQFVSRPVRARRDLSILAARLNETERAGTWRFDGVDAITPALSLGGAESSMPFEVFRRTCEEFLRTAPPAFDPFDPR